MHPLALSELDSVAAGLVSVRPKSAMFMMGKECMPQKGTECL